MTNSNYLKNKSSMLRHIEFGHTESITFLGEDFGIVRNPSFSYDTTIPYMSDRLFALICTGGGSFGDIDGRPFRIGKGDLCIILPGRQMAGTHANKDFRGIYFIMSSEFLSQLDLAHSFAMYHNVMEWPVVHLEQSQTEIVTHYADMCQSVIDHGNQATRGEVLVLLTKAMFASISDTTRIERTPLTQYDSRRNEIVQHFITLLEQNFKSRREVAWYAERLCITPKHLSAVLQAVTGMTATEWTEQFVSKYAQARLREPSIPIQQVSSELSFSTQSYFGRYFKRVMGMSPQAWRNANM